MIFDIKGANIENVPQYIVLVGGTSLIPNIDDYVSKISNLDIDDVTSKTINHILCEYYDEYSGVRLKSKKFLKEIE